jgi:hypothetical protein
MSARPQHTPEPMPRAAEPLDLFNLEGDRL